jgi:hypothetical protein
MTVMTRARLAPSCLLQTDPLRRRHLKVGYDDFSAGICMFCNKHMAQITMIDVILKDYDLALRDHYLEMICLNVPHWTLPKICFKTSASKLTTLSHTVMPITVNEAKRFIQDMRH